MLQFARPARAAAVVGPSTMWPRCISAGFSGHSGGMGDHVAVRTWARAGERAAAVAGTPAIDQTVAGESVGPARRVAAAGPAANLDGPIRPPQCHMQATSLDAKSGDDAWHGSGVCAVVCVVRATEHRVCCGVIGLWVSREHIVLRLVGLGRAICARCGRTSIVARALECRLCMLEARFPERTRSALREGWCAAAILAALGWVGACVARAQQSRATRACGRGQRSHAAWQAQRERRSDHSIQAIVRL